LDQLPERYLENSTRYESGIPKIRADMLEEIKTYRISEKQKEEMENNLNKVPFADFTNYDPPVEESVDHRETSPTELLDSAGSPHFLPEK
jgi:hypothetical protein